MSGRRTVRLQIFVAKASSSDVADGPACLIRRESRELPFASQVAIPSAAPYPF